DDAGVRYTLRGILEEAEVDVEEADDGAQALKRLGEGAFQLVISDLRMPKMDGLELLKRLQSTPSAPKLILITAHGSERNAVEAIKLGAHDYFRKPFEMEELLAVVRRAVGTVRLEAENERLASEANLLQSMIFASPAMSRLAVLIRRVAPRDITVVITGGGGAGKGGGAGAAVGGSSRAGRPSVCFDVRGLPT